MKNGKDKSNAVYLVQRFLFSDRAKQYNLTPYDVSILFVIASYLDMPAGKCFGKQITLAESTFMSVREFKRRSEKLSTDGFLLRYMKKKLYHYELGRIITGVDENEGAYWALMSPEKGLQ